MRYFCILLALVSLNTNAQNCRNLDKLTRIAKLTANTLLIADWAQTRHIAIDPRYTEGGIAKNFIGRYPSKNDVNKYFATVLLLNNVLPCFVSEKKRKIYYIGLSLFQYKVVRNNYSLGIKFEF